MAEMLPKPTLNNSYILFYVNKERGGKKTKKELIGCVHYGVEKNRVIAVVVSWLNN